jgi:predicted PurR-regulated permease PerM
MSEPPVKDFWIRLNNSALVRFLLLFGCGWAFVQLLAYFETVIVIFAFAAVLAFLLNYPVRWLRQFLPHGVAVIFVFLVGILVLAALTATVGLAVLSQAQQLISSITTFSTSLLPAIERLEEFLRSRNIQVDLDAIQQQLQNQFLAGISLGIGYSLATLQIFATNFVNLILIAVVAFFMLLDGERLWGFILKVVPKQSRDRFTVIIQRNFSGFLQGQLILMLFLTVSTFLVFLILQVPFPLVLSVIIGVFDLIPGIGATLGISLVLLIVLSQDVWLTLRVLPACIILQQVQDNLIAPRVMRDSVNVNPVVIFFALLVGARVAGLLGVFLAIPITGVMVSLLEIDEMKAEP